MDRIDLYCDVHEVKHATLLETTRSTETDEQVRARITAARKRQQVRFKSNARTNSTMSNRDIKQFAALSAEAKTLLDTAAQRLNISARAYMRTIKVARTIADLEQSEATTEAHVAEALAYRAQPLS